MGTPAMLVNLDDVDVALLDEFVVEAWLARTPKRLAAAYLGANDLVVDSELGAHRQ